MKPIDYVKKYNLSQGVDFNHNEFVIDLTNDFLTLLETGNCRESFKGFNNTVNAIRMKWDGINKKTAGQLPEKLWNYFFATIIAKMREELFPEIIQAQKKKNKEDYERRQEYRKFIEREKTGNFFDYFNFCNTLLVSFLLEMAVPTQSFLTLGLDTDATASDINTKYRELCMVHHPDKGGNHDSFIAITEAKNKCLMYVNSRS